MEYNFFVSDCDVVLAHWKLIQKLPSMITWGLLIQYLSYAVVIPIFLAIHLSTSLSVAARNSSDLLADSNRLNTIPFSVALGFFLPGALMSLPAPSMVSYEVKQSFIALWQPFPLWIGILQEIFPFLTSWLTTSRLTEQPKQRTIRGMRQLYTILLIAAGFWRISTLTLCFSSLLFPGLVSHQFSPSAVFTPGAWTPAAKMPSILGGALLFLQFDEMIGATAVICWSSTLYINASAEKGFWEWLSLLVKGIIIEALAGPAGFAVAAVWARDETIFAKYDPGEKAI